MLNWLIDHHVLLISIALCAALALWRGSAAERIGASANLAVALAWYVQWALLPPDARRIVELFLDGALAATFLILAIRYATLWLGGAMLLQGVQFALHAYYFVLEKAADILFSLVNNLVSTGVVICLLVGVFAHWRTQAKSRATVAPVVHA